MKVCCNVKLVVCRKKYALSTKRFCSSQIKNMLQNKQSVYKLVAVYYDICTFYIV